MKIAKLQIGGAAVLALVPHVTLFVADGHGRDQERDLPHAHQEIDLEAFDRVQYVMCVTSANAVWTPGLLVHFT